MYMLSTSNLETFLIKSSRERLSFFAAEGLNSLKIATGNRRTWVQVLKKKKRKSKALKKQGVGEVNV